jgi:hypothetical protein
MNSTTKRTNNAFAVFFGSVLVPLLACDGRTQEQTSDGGVPLGGQVVSGLVARAVCDVQQVKAGESAVIEVWLENVSDRAITYYDYTKRWDSWLVTVLVDHRPVVGATVLDTKGLSSVPMPEGDNRVLPPGSWTNVTYTEPIPREAFVTIKPGEKVVCLRKSDFRTARFISETVRDVPGPFRIPGEHIVQIEYKNQASGGQFGLDAWTGTIRSNVITVKVMSSISDDQARQQTALMLNSLSERTQIQISAFGEPVTTMLIEKLRSLPAEVSNERHWIDLCLRTIGRPAVPYLIQALEGPGPQDKAAESQYRQPLVWILGRSCDPRAGEPLLKLWNKQDSVVEKPLLAIALGLVGESRAVEPILAALQECLEKARRTGDWNADSLAMRNYAEAFWHLHDQRAVPVLKEMLTAGPQTTKNGKEYLVRQSAAVALRAMGIQVAEDKEAGVFTIIEK